MTVKKTKWETLTNHFAKHWGKWCVFVLTLAVLAISMSGYEIEDKKKGRKFTKTPIHIKDIKK
jgi:hypothetical protein